MTVSTFATRRFSVQVKQFSNQSLSLSNPYLTLVSHTYHPPPQTEPKVCELYKKIEWLRSQKTKQEPSKTE